MYTHIYIYIYTHVYMYLSLSIYIYIYIYICRYNRWAKLIAHALRTGCSISA